MVNNGKKKSPLQVMVGHAVYDKCKSKELIESFNHGSMSISYDEVRRLRSLLAGYVISKSKNGQIPIPSHFNTKDFVVAAFDNSDYKDKSSLTDPKEEHNTAIVLFQDINLPQNLDRGKVSDLVDINIAKRQYIQDLDCQKILSYYLPK